MTWKEGLRATIFKKKVHDDDLITSKDFRALFVFMVDTAEDLIFSVESDLHIAEDGESTFGNEALRLLCG